MQRFTNISKKFYGHLHKNKFSLSDISYCCNIILQANLRALHPPPLKNSFVLETEPRNREDILSYLLLTPKLFCRYHISIIELPPDQSPYLSRIITKVTLNISFNISMFSHICLPSYQRIHTRNHHMISYLNPCGTHFSILINEVIL